MTENNQPQEANTDSAASRDPQKLTTKQLHQLLKRMQEEMDDIRIELAVRERTDGEEAVEAMPEDWSKLTGSWSDLTTFIRSLVRHVEK